jgi:hypothetical protein
MAKIYANAAGALLRMLATEEEERQFPDPPPGAAGVLDFDEDTNAAVIAGVHAAWDAHTLLGGVLRLNGQAVTIAPPSQEYTDRQQLQTYWQNLQTYLGLSNPTNAQTVAAVKTIIRVLRLFYRAFKRSGQMAGPGK